LSGQEPDSPAHQLEAASPAAARGLLASMIFAATVLVPLWGVASAVLVFLLVVCAAVTLHHSGGLELGTLLVAGVLGSALAIVGATAFTSNHRVARKQRREGHIATGRPVRRWIEDHPYLFLAAVLPLAAFLAAYPNWNGNKVVPDVLPSALVIATLLYLAIFLPIATAVVLWRVLRVTRRWAIASSYWTGILTGAFLVAGYHGLVALRDGPSVAKAEVERPRFVRFQSRLSDAPATAAIAVRTAGFLEALDELAEGEDAVPPDQPSLLASGFGSLPPGGSDGHNAETCARKFLVGGGDYREAYRTGAGVVRRRAPPSSDAEQILLDAVFITCRAPRADARPYFVKIARRLANAARSRQGTIEVPVGDASCETDFDRPPWRPEERFHSRDCLSKVNEQICKLDDHHQAVMTLRVDGVSYPEIGVALGKSEEAVRKDFERSVEALKADLPASCLQ
jgi:DNA-directed RNA polymerase specialized sigma24 family protein